MPLTFEPLQVNSLKDATIHRLEELILAGELKPGGRLPAERDLAARLGVSRPVLHEALVDLAAKGLVSILPRRGVVVNDFRKTGSFAVLSSLLTYNQTSLDPHFVTSLFAFRILIETEAARTAAGAAKPEEIEQLRQLAARGPQIPRDNFQALTDHDFELHLFIAILSGNFIYPLVINSFKNVYTHFTGAFFQHWGGSPEIDAMYAGQQALVEAIAAHQPEQAAAIMSQLLTRGEALLKGEMG